MGQPLWSAAALVVPAASESVLGARGLKVEKRKKNELNGVLGVGVGGFLDFLCEASGPLPMVAAWGTTHPPT
jgi:hypothetical protein